MADVGAHLAQARANIGLVRHLLATADQLGPVAPQWAVVVAFYAAVHCLEAHFRQAGLAPSDNHRERASRLFTTNTPHDIVLAYKQLQQWSEQARYLLGTFDARFVGGSVVTELRTVAQFVGIHDLDDPPPAP